jgi:hypothetical protein
MSVKAANHFGGIWVNEPARNRVGVNEWFGWLFAESASIFVFSSTEVRIYNSGHRFPKPMEGQK